MRTWGGEPVVEGRVRLDSGGPAAGARVLLFDMTDLGARPLAATTDGSGFFSLSLISPAGAGLPEAFELGANYPNPFNPSTLIPYQLPAPMHVQLEVFNILGQRVATLVDGEQPAGLQTASWGATDAAGQPVGAGVYLYRLRGDGMQETRSMVLIDGQAGIPSGRGGSSLKGRTRGVPGDRPLLGLTVSGPGLAPYVDPAFQVEAGMAPLDFVVEVPGGGSRGKVASGGILGDVDNTGVVDFIDALLVALYSWDPAVALPENGDIWLGDVNVDGQVDMTDALLIAAYLNDPSDPSLPEGIGETAVPVSAALSPDPSTVSFVDDGTWHRFLVEAAETVLLVVNPEGTTPRLEIASGGSPRHYCPAEAEDQLRRETGQYVYLTGCAAGEATVELRRSDGRVVRTHTFTVTATPLFDLVVVSASYSIRSPGQDFTLSVTVHNQGAGESPGTFLRYYASPNGTITTGDTLIAETRMRGLAASGTRTDSVNLSVPSSIGTYYYGACVASVSGESETTNNCSPAVAVNVGILGSLDDHGNTRDGATVLSLDTSLAGEIETGSDVDYFKVGIGEGGVLTVLTTGWLDTVGELEDGFGSVLVRNGGSGGGRNFWIDHFVSAGTYYIRVEGNGSDTGSYTILATVTPSVLPVPLTDDSGASESPAWSPDGRHIAFSSRRDDNWDIYLMEADGTNLRRLTNSEFNESPAWSPDGRRIAFSSFRDGNWDIYVMEGAGETNPGRLSNRPRRLTNHSGSDRTAAWSPDGRHIAFTSGRHGREEIYVMEADGTNQRRLTDLSGYTIQPAWSPDGRHIAFSSFGSSGNYWIGVVETDGTNFRRLTDGEEGSDTCPAWSPDGHYIAFSSRRDSRRRIYVMEADGTNLRRLTNDDAWDPAWSPDGYRIAFSSGRGGNWRIYVMDFRGWVVSRNHRGKHEP